MTTLEQLIVDLGTAPTGGVDEDLKIVPMSEQMSEYFIQIVAKHLVKLGYKRVEE